MGMNATGDYLSQSSKGNQEQMQQKNNTANQDTWTCPNDQTENTGKFCSECGQAKPVQQASSGIQMRCENCHNIVTITHQMPKFCPECGAPFKGLPL